MNKFFGRKSLLDRIRQLHEDNQHVSLVGARALGKTALLQTVVEQHAKGSDLFAGAGIVDLRHDPPMSMDSALRRIAAVLQSIFKGAASSDLRELADQIALAGTAEELYDSLTIAVEMVAEGRHRILLALDGCDAVLQNSAIPRNLWDNLRALAQKNSLRLMTSSRDHLHRLCYNPDARTSDFFRIFYDEPLIVGPFEDADWKELFAEPGVKVDGPGQKELANWTGGHPDLLDLLLGRLHEVVKGSPISKREVDEAAEALLARASGRLNALWLDCPEESRNDIIQLARAEMSLADVSAERVRYLVERGIAVEAGRKMRLTNRLIERLAGQRRSDVSGARKMFERPEDFATNIRTVLELRLGHVQGTDPELIRLVRRAVRHIPDEPDAVLGSARDILDRALDLVWALEAPGGRVPLKWIEHWRDAEVSTGRSIQATSDYSQNSAIPEERGKQCALLRLATGQNRIRPIAARVSKATYVLIEHMNQVGDLKNHSKGAPTITMAVAFCMAAIELAEALGPEKPAEPSRG